MTGAALPRGTVTMLFTDVEGSTRLLKQLGERYGELLGDHRRLLRAAFAAHGGREIDTQGDAFFVAFARARNAVEAAVEAQRALAAHEWPGGVECRVRMGLHTGEPSVGDEGYHGIGLHRGARIAAAAHGGQILLSNTTAELIQDDLPAGVELRDLGVQRLKDIERPERIYQVVAAGLAPAFPPLRTADAPGKARTRGSRRVVLGAACAVLAADAAAAVFLGTRGDGSPAHAAGVAANSVGIVRSADGRLTGQVSVGASPSAVTVGARSIWVANIDDHSVSRIDPVKEAEVQEIQVGEGPAGIAFGAGFVWVTNGLDGTVMKIDPKTNTVVQTTPVGNAPAGIAYGANTVWVANSNDDSVSRIDPATGKPRGAPVPVPAGADGIAVGSDGVWVTSQSTGTVTRIDPRSGRVVQPIRTGGNGAGAIAVGDGFIWVANGLDGTVTEIDPGTNAIRTTIPVGDGPNGIAVTPGAVWVSNELAGTLSRIDPARGAVVTAVRTGNRPEGVALASGQMFVAVRASGLGHRGGTLTVAQWRGHGLDSDDPAIAYSGQAGQLLAMTNDGLTGYRRVGGSNGTRLVPDLATSLPSPSPDGKSYTFRLRPRIRYSTGAPVRGVDFRRAIERTLTARPRSPWRDDYLGIVGSASCGKAPGACDLSKGIVATPGSRTITFNLTSPDPDFLLKLALSPAYAVPASTPLRLRRAAPASGPYRIASFDPRTGARLVRNPYFREWSPVAQPSGYPDEILLRSLGSPAAEVDAVDGGKADVATDVSAAPQPMRDRLKTQDASRLRLNPVAWTFYVALDTTVPPFDDVSARRAVNFAIDRQRMQTLFGGPDLGQITCQILPPNFDAYRRYCPYTVDRNAAGTWSGSDLARAQALVGASGTRGEPVTVWGSSADRASGGAYFVSVLKRLGYKARFVVTDVYAPQKHALQASFQGWSADFASPSGYILPTLTCAAVTGSADSNAARFCDRAIDAEIAHARALQASDPEAASQLWAKVDRDIVDQAPWVPYVNLRDIEFVSARVGNYQSNPQWGTLLDQLWVR